ncbi:hypothetical protein AQUCO_01900140v1 [Aquilegia coerulea]|uniref:Uncharacterized protein n=1 Tax=Aquilegia coerulea TaxID=218851 RepID=A0A2G5DJ52_AQUCA|nr:hypothetical protein AQUCO_01900140v1 [Aquilegia coerulea]
MELFFFYHDDVTVVPLDNCRLSVLVNSFVDFSFSVLDFFLLFKYHSLLYSVYYNPCVTLTRIIFVKRCLLQHI